MLDNYTYLPAWWALLSYYRVTPRARLHVYARERARARVLTPVCVNLTTVDVAEYRGRRPDP